MSVPSPQTDRSIRARLLGSIDIRVGDRLLVPGSWPRRQARTIFLMLLATPGHRISRDVLLEALWPDQEPAAQLNALYKAIHALRRTLEPDLGHGKQSAYVDISNEQVSVRPHASFQVDVDLFEGHLLAAERLNDPRDRLRAALTLYRGPLLVDEPYQDWPIERRESLESLRLHATLKLAGLDRDRGQPGATLTFLEALLIDQPACEDAHLAIIEAHLQNGQTTLVLQQVERCRLALQRHLGEEPGPEIEALAQRARSAQSQIRVARSPGELLYRHRLPGIPTPTIGRRSEVASIRALLDDPDGPRLITIVGVGGVGKTRVAIETARAVAGSFPDGASFFDLSAVREVALVPAAIASVLGLRASDHRTLRELIRETLQRYPRQLLVLDNLEHLEGVDRFAADLLSEHPALKILATSREALRIRSEWRFPLKPFIPPDEASSTESRQLRRNDAVALYLQCARAWNQAVDEPIFDLTDIAELVRELDGLPLAIELAAARSTTLSTGEILAQLSNRFELLRDGPRDLPERQRALEASIAWSYDLLETDDQRLFRELSVFANGVEIDTLQSLFGEEAIARANQLAECSLVRWEHHDGGRRAVMLESVRQFAERRLDESGDLPAARRAHVEYFAALVARADEQPVERAVIEVEWIQRLARDHDNLHLALSHSLEAGDAETALMLTNGLGFYWMTRLAPAEAREWTERALALDPDVQTDDAGWSAIWGAEQSALIGDWESVERFAARARSIWRERNFTSGLTWADGSIANALARTGNHDEALEIHRRNVDVFKAIRDYEGIVTALAGVAWSLERIGRYDDAVESLLKAIEVARKSEQRVLESFMRARLVQLHVDLDRLAEADRHARAGEPLARLIGDLQSLPLLLAAQALASIDRDEGDEALAMGRRSLAAYHEAPNRRNLWWGLLTCLAIETRLGSIDDALATGIELIAELDRDAEELGPVWSRPVLGRLLLAINEPELALASAAETSDEPNIRRIPPAVLRHRIEVSEAARSRLQNHASAPRDRSLSDSDDVLRRIEASLRSALTVRQP